jgi:ATP-dependent 26S proteasome regulatory subunit
MSEKSVKETKELLTGVNEVVILLLTHLKDGFQISKDLPAIFAELVGNGELQAKLQKAYEGVGQVDDEIKDLNLQEAVELGLLQVQYVEKIIEALKKKDA